MRTVLVTGVSSRPGYAVARALLGKGYHVVGVYNRHPVSLGGAETLGADLREKARELVEDYSPSVVVHAAAIGLVDYCEENKQHCYQVNTEATRELLRAAARKGASIIYISTDYVFDGERGLYREEDVPAPINYYGLTKLLGEEIARSLGGTVIRVSAVFGPGPGRPNFAQVLYEKLSRGEKILAATDQYLSPTYNKYIGEAVTRLLERHVEVEVLHVAGPRLSRYEYAQLVARIMGVNTGLIEPTTMDKILYRAPRPRDSSLDNTKARQLLGLPLSDIETALREYLGTLREEGNENPLSTHQ